jgi:hypothetical protein
MVGICFELHGKRQCFRCKLHEARWRNKEILDAGGTVYWTWRE